MSEEIRYFVDSEVGMTMGDTVVKEIHNAHGQHYWIANAPIGTIFGAEVEGELKGIGPTRDAALERLKEERKQLNESLWA